MLGREVKRWDSYTAEGLDLKNVPDGLYLLQFALLDGSLSEAQMIRVLR